MSGEPSLKSSSTSIPAGCWQCLGDVLRLNSTPLDLPDVGWGTEWPGVRGGGRNLSLVSSSLSVRAVGELAKEKLLTLLDRFMSGVLGGEEIGILRSLLPPLGWWSDGLSLPFVVLVVGKGGPLAGIFIVAAAI